MSLSEDEMMELLKKSPAEFVQFLKGEGIDFSKKAEDLDLARKIVAERFSIDKRNMRAVEFVFWFSYYLEREVQDLIVKPEVDLGARESAIQILTDKLHFGDKISVISELHLENDKKDKLIVLMRKVQDLRNHVAHGRFENLKYGGFDLSGADGQLLILGDLMNAFLRSSDFKAKENVE